MKGMRIKVERVGQSLAVLFVVLMMQGCRTGGTEIVNMQCEYQNHPIGIDSHGTIQATPLGNRVLSESFWQTVPKG